MKMPKVLIMHDIILFEIGSLKNILENNIVQIGVAKLIRITRVNGRFLSPYVNSVKLLDNNMPRIMFFFEMKERVR